MTTDTHRLTGPEALMARLLDRTEADGRAVARMKRLRSCFGRDPVELVLRLRCLPAAFGDVVELSE